MAVGRSRDPNKLFVGGLNCSTTDEDLIKYFESMGIKEVEPHVVMNGEESRWEGL